MGVSSRGGRSTSSLVSVDLRRVWRYVSRCCSWQFRNNKGRRYCLQSANYQSPILLVEYKSSIFQLSSMAIVFVRIDTLGTQENRSAG